MFTRLRGLLHTINHRKMSTATGGTAGVVNSNPACCSIPPVQSNYTPKGVFKPYAGFKRVYFTGPENSDMAIVAVYDIFGFKEQTQQGADILARSMNATVLMPDFFEPNEPWDSSRFPPKSDKDKQELQDFFAGPANPEDSVNKLIQVGKELRNGGVKHLGAYGMCWGGKVTILGGANKFKEYEAVAALHPAMLSAPDADELNVPLGLFISKDEPKAEYDKMVETLSQKPFANKNMYKYYPTMFHGWAAARANLDDPENKKQFEDVYSQLQLFFSTAFEADRGVSQGKI